MSMIFFISFVGATFALFSNHSVRILSPSNCDFNVFTVDSDSLSIEIETDSAHSDIVQIAVHSSANSAWTFDIPPTPYGAQLFYWCQQRLVTDMSHCTAPMNAASCDVMSSVGAMETIRFDLPIKVTSDRQFDIQVRLFDRTGAKLLAPIARTLVSGGSRAQFVSEPLANQMLRKRELLAADMAVSSEHRRRATNGHQFVERAIFSRDNFDDAFVPGLLDALDSGNRSRILSVVSREAESGIFSLHLFTADFCRRLLLEIEAFLAEPELVRRPNSMNAYGVVLSDLEPAQEFFTELTRRVVQPLARVLFEEWLNGELDHHHAFSVKYSLGGDRGLDFHMDQSVITLNVCLGREFSGGAVYFRGVRDTPSEHVEQFNFNHRVGGGDAIIHVGQHWHGAHTIDSGERHNLILWTRSIASLASPSERFAAQCFDSAKFAPLLQVPE
jgi:hypothetical protein